MRPLPQGPFCLIRHGQTDANRDGIIAGRTQAHLTETGRIAARALAAYPWPEPIALFSSPQDRARETARLAFPSHTPRIVADLRERDWGLFEGRPIAELPPRMATPEGGESWEDLLARVRDALTACLEQAGTALPVIVAHSGTIRAARALVGLDHTGPSAANTTPLFYTNHADGWQERALPLERTNS